MKFILLLSLLLLTSCKFDLFTKEDKQKAIEDNLIALEDPSVLSKFSLRDNPFKTTEAIFDSNEFYIIQGYTLASALGCAAEKITALLPQSTKDNHVKLADLANVSNFYVVAKNKIVASIKEQTFSLKRILTEIGEDTLRKDKEDTFSKSNFFIRGFKGLFKTGHCLGKIKEDIISGTWMAIYKQQHRIVSCDKRDESILYTIREAKIKNFVVDRLLPEAGQRNSIIEVWDVFIPRLGNQRRDQKVAYYVKVETNNYTEYIFMAQKSGKLIQIASLKQGDIEQIVGSLPDKIAGLPGRNEVWKVRMRPGLPINPFLYLATAVIKTDNDQEELRKAAKILDPSQKTSPSCRK